MVQAHDPDLDRAERLLLIPDLVHHFLCGSNVGEYTNATTTQCFDARRGTWAVELLARLEHPDAHASPRWCHPGTRARLAAARCRRPRWVGTVRVVAPGTHDTASAVAAIAAAE